MLDTFVSQWRMVTREELAERLRSVSVEEVAKEAKVSTKTVYRLRHLRNSPKLDLVQRLMAAIAVVEKRNAKARQKAVA